jgi:hypothetical protein
MQLLPNDSSAKIKELFASYPKSQITLHLEKTLMKFLLREASTAFIISMAVTADILKSDKRYCGKAQKIVVDIHSPI